MVLTRESFNPSFGITLAVRDASLDDPQLVALVRQALVYRKVEGAVVELRGSRLAVRLGEPIYASVDGATYESPSPVDAARLAELQRSGVSFGRLVAATDSVAS